MTRLDWPIFRECCAACGRKGSDDDINLKTCMPCKLVKYCGVACQKSHRPLHKKECKKRATEILLLNEEALFKEPPPREDCPICFILLPHPTKSTWHNCCGKEICDGCMISVTGNVCAFCRARTDTTDEEDIERIKNRMELNDSGAFNTMGCHYHDGFMDLIPQDHAKAREMWYKAANLGCILAHRNLAARYDDGDGVEKDVKRAIHHWEFAAMGGHEVCRHNLGVMEEQKGNLETRAIKHYILAARAGYEDALYQVKRGFLNGYATKYEFESTLRAYQKSLDEVKNEQRDKAEEYRACMNAYYAANSARNM